MSDLSARSTFGHGASSLETVRAALGMPRPVSVRAMAPAFTRDLVFDQPLVTADGVALGGHHTVTLRRDGTYRYHGHVRATGWPSYSVSVLTTLSYPIPDPGGGPAAPGQMAFAASGRVHGTNESGDRNYSWDQVGSSPMLAAQWDLVRQGTFQRNLQFDTDWFGTAGGVVNFVAQVVGMSVFGPAGVAIVVLGAAADALNLEHMALPGMVGIALSGVTAFVFGPGVMIPAFLVGAVVTAELVDQRHLTEAERVFARQVFGNTLPVDRILLTNLLGIGQRPFTCPAPGGAILVNMGEGFADPMSYTGRGRPDDKPPQAPGQLLIHELTHAWQIGNDSFTPDFYCRAVNTSSGTLGSDRSAYDYGEPNGQPWPTFGTEQQASIVDDWYGGDKSIAWTRQKQYPQMDTRPAHEPGSNPYYRYIRDNIKTGIVG